MALPGVSSLWRANDQGGQHALKDPLQGELCLGPSGRQCHWRHTGPAAGRHNETRQLGSRAHSEQCAESNQSQPGAGGGGSAGDEQRAGPQARRPAGKLRAGLDGCAHISVCVLCVRVSCVRDRVLGGACQFGGSDLVEVRSAALRAAALAVGLPAEFPATAQGLLPSFDSAPQSPVPVPRRVRWRNGQTAFGASLQPARTPKLTTLPLPSTITAKLQPPLPNLPASPSLLAASLTRPRPPVARRLRLSLRALRCSRWMRARPGRPVSPARPVSRR